MIYSRAKIHTESSVAGQPQNSRKSLESRPKIARKSHRISGSRSLLLFLLANAKFLFVKIGPNQPQNSRKTVGKQSYKSRKTVKINRNRTRPVFCGKFFFVSRLVFTALLPAYVRRNDECFIRDDEL